MRKKWSMSLRPRSIIEFPAIKEVKTSEI
jgi:hypothetical protein